MMCARPVGVQRSVSLTQVHQVARVSDGDHGINLADVSDSFGVVAHS